MTSAPLALGPQQAAAVPLFLDWWRRVQAGDRSVRPGFVVLGYGGTGKTVLTRRLIEEIGLAPEEVAGGAMQANAANRLREVTGWECRTLHSWNYKVETRVGGARWFAPNPDPAVRRRRLLVLDEISQVSLDLWRDTVAHGVPLLILGDPGQLQPVAGVAVAPYLEPDVVLTEIHRQAAGNPIVHWSMEARRGAEIPFGEFRDEATGEVALRKVPLGDLTAADYARADVVLVARNATRIAVNHAQRTRLGITSPLPQAGEKVICRKNQDDYALVNGFTGEVLEAGAEAGLFSYRMTVRLLDTGVVVPARSCLKEALGLPAPPCPAFLRRDASEFAYGYARTVHGFIGQEAPEVLVIDEHPRREGRDRWLYTALTRGSVRTTLAVPFP